MEHDFPYTTLGKTKLTVSKLGLAANSHVHVCMTSPTNLKQLEENFKAVRLGPLSDEEITFMKNFGDAVYKRKKRFLDGRYRPW